MRRLSSMYQNQQSQVKAMENAEKKAAILPNMNQQTKRKWNIQEWDKQPFNIPNSKPMTASKGNPERNNINSIPNGNKTNNKPNYKIKQKKNKHVPPPSGPMPNYYGNNSQEQWANQQLGYGSISNQQQLSYQQSTQQINNSFNNIIQQIQQYNMQNKQYYNSP
eukprot:463263_1